MPRLTFTTLVAASLAASTMGQHVPEYRLRGSPVPDTATAPPVGLRDSTGDMGGDIKLKSSLTGTVRFMGNMTVSDTQSSYYNRELTFPEYATAKAESIKKRTGEVQFVTFSLKYDFNAIRIDRGNVNGIGASGNIVETMFLFSELDGGVRIVRTKPWNIDRPFETAIPPVSTLCSMDEKVFHKSKSKKDPPVVFPESTYDFLGWTMGFEDSPGVATSWRAKGGFLDWNEDTGGLPFDATLGYPFGLDGVAFNSDEINRGKDTAAKGGGVQGNWNAENSYNGYDESLEWSTHLDGKWQGLPTAFKHSWQSYNNVIGSSRKVSLEAVVEPYELKATSGDVLQAEDLFPIQNPHKLSPKRLFASFPKCTE